MRSIFLGGRLTVWKCIAASWILFRSECQAQSQLEEVSWLLPRIQHPLEIDLFFQSAAETDPALRAPGAGDVFLATKEAFQALGTLNGSWYLVSSVSVGAVASCNVITGIHRGFRAFLSRATPQSGISRGAEQLIWSYFRKSNRPFQLADGLTRGCVPSLARQEHEDAPSWGKKVIPEANPWSWTRIFPLIEWNHFAFSETFLWARIKCIIIFQWCILRSECGFLMGI